MKKKFSINGEEFVVDIMAKTGDQAMFVFNGVEYHFHNVGNNKGKIVIMRNGINSKVPIAYTSKAAAFVAFSQHDFKVETTTTSRAKKSTEELAGHMVSPMPGKILKVMSKVGDNVKKGDSILVMEAMKMEHTIKASCNGKIESILCGEGEQVPGGQELVVIKEEA